jgi:hypothetical protein
MDGPLATAGAAKLQPGLGPAARCSHERLIGWRCLRTPYIACAVAGDLERATTTESLTSTDAGITTSFPGLGPLTGGRVAEADGIPRPIRFQDAKAYAGTVPITRASGKTTAVLHRRVKTSASPRRPAQPLRRLGAPRLPHSPLPQHRAALRRNHRLPRARTHSTRQSSLTT